MRALLDACVLYPTVLREILLKSAEAGLFEPLWSDRILDEWRHVSARSGPEYVALTEGDIALITVRWPDALVARDAETERSVWLPDESDIHVLASAVAGKADVIVTLNLRDFPSRELDPHAVRAIHPDALLRALWQDHPQLVSDAVASVVSRARQLSGEELDQRKLLKKARLPRLAKALVQP